MNPKTCMKYTREDWILYAAGDVSSWRRRAIERHSADCSDCAAIRSEVDALFQQTQTAFRAAMPPSELDEHIWRKTAARRDAATPRRLPLLRGLAFGAVMTACLAGGVALLLPGSPGHPAVAFAQVERAMSEIQTATWTDTMTSEWNKGTGKDKKTWKWYQERPAKFENWVQFDPPRYSLRQVRQTGETQDSESHFHEISDGKYTLFTNSQDHHYMRSDAPPNDLWPDASPEEAMRREVLFPRDLPPVPGAETQDKTRKWRKIERTPWRQSADRLSNRDVLKFSSRITEIAQMPNNKPWRRTTDTTIWVDPTSYRILRRESHSIPVLGGGVEWRRISENFRYNETPPPGTMEIAPPPVGEPYDFTDLSRDGWIRKRPPAEEQEPIRALVKKAIGLWNQRDSKAFADLWDFDYSDLQWKVYNPQEAPTETAGDRRRHWTNRAAQGEPYKTWNIQKIWTAESWGGIYVRQNESDPFPPDTRPKQYSVTVTGYATFAPGGKPTLCDASFRLVRDGGTYRITYINMHKKLAVSAHFKPGPAR